MRFLSVCDWICYSGSKWPKNKQGNWKLNRGKIESQQGNFKQTKQAGLLCGKFLHLQCIQGNLIPKIVKFWRKSHWRRSYVVSLLSQELLETESQSLWPVETGLDHAINLHYPLLLLLRVKHALGLLSNIREINAWRPFRMRTKIKSKKHAMSTIAKIKWEHLSVAFKIVWLTPHSNNFR